MSKEKYKYSLSCHVWTLTVYVFTEVGHASISCLLSIMTTQHQLCCIHVLQETLCQVRQILFFSSVINKIRKLLLNKSPFLIELKLVQIQNRVSIQTVAFNCFSDFFLCFKSESFCFACFYFMGFKNKNKILVQMNNLLLFLWFNCRPPLIWCPLWQRLRFSSRCACGCVYLLNWGPNLYKRYSEDRKNVPWRRQQSRPC